MEDAAENNAITADPMRAYFFGIPSFLKTTYNCDPFGDVVSAVLSCDGTGAFIGVFLS
jgi:hypothetical protein